MDNSPALSFDNCESMLLHTYALTRVISIIKQMLIYIYIYGIYLQMEISFLYFKLVSKSQ